MKHPIRIFALALVAGLLLTSGCGKQNTENPRFNETLGDSPTGVPVGDGPIDTGILQDTTSYKPADYEPLVERREKGADVAAGSADEGEEATAIRTDLRDGLLALTDLDLAGFLDAFAEQNVGALRSDEFLEAADGFADAVRNLFDTLAAKDVAGAPGVDIDWTKFLPALTDAIMNAVSVAVLDDQTATATFAMSRFELPEEAKQQIDEAMKAAAEAQTGGTNAANPAMGGMQMDLSADALLAMAQGFSFDIPFRKTDAGWRIDPKITFAEEHAELLAEGFDIGTRFCNEATQQVAAAESLTQEQVEQLFQQVGLRYMAEAGGWSARAQMAAMSLVNQVTSGGAEPTGNEAAPEGAGEAPADKPEVDPNVG